MTDRAQRWQSQAEDNVDRWGNQTAPTLFLAMVEEMGEVAEALMMQATLPSADAEGDGPDRARDAWSFINDTKDLGHDVRDFLEANFEDPAGEPKSADTREQRRQDIGGAHLDEPASVQDEVDDLAPLVYQLTWEVQSQIDQPGIWVQDGAERWHRSTSFDGYDHGLACGLTITNTDTVADTQMDTTTVPDGDVCDVCLAFHRGDADA